MSSTSRSNSPPPPPLLQSSSKSSSSVDLRDKLNKLKQRNSSKEPSSTSSAAAAAATVMASISTNDERDRLERRERRFKEAEVAEVVSEEEKTDVELLAEDTNDDTDDGNHNDDDNKSSPPRSRTRSSRRSRSSSSRSSESIKSAANSSNSNYRRHQTRSRTNSGCSSDNNTNEARNTAGYSSSNNHKRQNAADDSDDESHSSPDDDDDEVENNYKKVKRKLKEAAAASKSAPKAASALKKQEDEMMPSTSNAASTSQQQTSATSASIASSTVVYYAALQGCRSVEEYECLNKIEEGAYGVVFRARDKKTNEVVALKRLKMEKEKEGFPITSLREVDTLLKAQHLNVVTVREIVVGSNMDKIYMVMDYVEHDLKSLMQYSMKKPFMMSEVKALMLQLLRGVAHLHDNWIIHRDLKTSNLLLSHKGILKIADFGLAREYGSPLKEYTRIVVTLWYRSPELLLNTKLYSTGVDIWSVGCIFGELMLMKALFPGKSEKDQLDKIFKDLGTPNEKIWPEFKDLPLTKELNFPNFAYNTLRSRFGTYLSDKGFELINKFLTYDPKRRITADEALKHSFFQESPLPIDPSMFQTWPARSEGLGKKIAKDSEPRAPSAGKAFEKLIGEEEGFKLQLPVATGFTLR